MSNLIHCVECGHGVSQRASCCPNCQTQNFKGVICKACKEAVKVSEAISIIVERRYGGEENYIKKVSIPGENISFSEWDGGRDRSFPDSSDYEDYEEYERAKISYQIFLNGLYSEYNKSHYKLHQKCLDSITEKEVLIQKVLIQEEQEIFNYECSSCFSKFRLELYPSQAQHKKTCKTCGEPDVFPKNILELQKRLEEKQKRSEEKQAKLADSRANCFNCKLPVIKSKGTKIFQYNYKDDCSVETVHQYVHQVCSSEEFLKSSHYLELEDFIELEKECASIDRKYKIESITKAVIKYLIIIIALIVLYLLLLHPVIPKITHSFNLLSKVPEKINNQTIILSSLVVGIIPLLGELLILICLILVLPPLYFAAKYDYGLAVYLLLLIGAFLGTSVRYWLTSLR